jgi:N-acetylneuraminic acid mutarotase
MSFFECDKKLHIFGGANFNEDIVHDDYHIYDPLEKSWSKTIYQNHSSIRAKFDHATAV